MAQPTGMAADRSIATDAHMNSIKNPELVKQFESQIKSGLVFLFFMKPSEKNPAWIDCYFAQGREVTAPNNMNRDLPALSSWELMMKGWDGPSIVRHRDVFLAENVAKLGLKEGSLLAPDLNIAQRDTIKYPDRTKALNPRQNTEGKVLVNADNQPIYRQSSIVVGNEDLDILFDFKVSDIDVDDHVARMEEKFDREDAAAASAATAK